MSISVLMLGVVLGLALASVYMLISLSLTLLLAASGIFNFTQGTIVMIGTVLSYSLGVRLGLPAWATAGLIVLAGVLLGLLTYLMAVWPATGRSRSLVHTTIFTTMGLGLAINAIVALWFGADSLPVPSYVSDAPVRLLGVPVRPAYLVMISVGVVVPVLIEQVIRRTSIGHIFRTTLEDPEYASMLGIDVRVIITLTFALAGGLSGLAGYLVAPLIQASAFTAQELAFYGFAGMAIGGFGSFSGALLGGLVVGMLAGLVPAVVDPSLAMPLIWATVIGVLLVKPVGLLGTAGLFGSAKHREI